MTNEYVAFVRLDDVEDYCRLGWMPSSIDGGLIGTPHGDWSIIMAWKCGCQIRRIAR